MISANRAAVVASGRDHPYLPLDCRKGNATLALIRAATPRLAAVLLLLGVALFAVMHRDAADPAAIATALRDQGIWGPVLFVLIYALGAVVLFPAALLSLAGGAVFGPVWGAVLDLAGATLGAGAAFLLARHLAAGWVQARVGGRLARLVAGVEAQGWRFVALARLVPVLPYTVVNYAFGLTRVGFWPYLAASAIAMVPGAIAYPWLGYAGMQAASGNAAAVRYGLLGLALLAVAALLPRMLRRRRAPA